MPLYFHDLYTDGIHPDARFPRDRYRLIAARFTAGATAQWVRVEAAPLATKQDVLMAHEPNYVERFLSAQMPMAERRKIGLRPWTPTIIPRTMHIMGGALAGLRHVHTYGGVAAIMAGGTHHAHVNWGSGYCVFNDLAICARVARQHLGYSRVLVLDLDVHQGDGTATILANDAGVLTVSVHCRENFPFNKATSHHDLPVPAGSQDGTFLATVDEALAIGVNFHPDLILFQAGVDGLKTDKLGRLELTRDGMRERNQRVFNLCTTLNVPCVVFMGGGYSRPIDATIDAFFDLFWQAARTHAAHLGHVMPDLATQSPTP